MSNLYGSIPESARQTVPTARGHRALTVRAASWQGAVEVRLVHDKEKRIPRDMKCIKRPHHGGGIHERISSGTVGESQDG